MRTLNRIVSWLPLAGVVGCYSYTPIDVAAAPSGTEVRAHITGAASDRVGPLLGNSDTRVLIGSVVENSGGQMTLDVAAGSMPTVSATVVPLHTRISIVPADLVGLEERKLDKTRTVLFTGGILAGVAVGVGFALHSGADSDPGKIPTEPPPIVRIPIITFHF